MREANIPWDQWTYFHLINAVVGSGQVELSLRLLAKMRKDGVRPTASHYTLAFVGLAQAGFYEDAARVFRRLASIRGLATRFSYNMMISVNTRRGEMEAAEETCREMEEEGFDMDAMTFRTLMEGYTNKRDYFKVVELWRRCQQCRSRFEAVIRDPSVTGAARFEAFQRLNDAQAVSSWRRCYFYMIDACVYTDDWYRGVKVMEEMIRKGLPPDSQRHAQMLKECSPEVKSMLPPGAFTELEDAGKYELAELRLSVSQQMEWRRTLPNLSTKEILQGQIWKGDQPQSLHTILTSRSRSRPREINSVDLPNLYTPLLVPPHVFCANFSPEWIPGDSKGSDPTSSRSRFEIVDAVLDGGTVNSKEAYRIVHDFHHATSHRRKLEALHLPENSNVLARRVPESPATLRLFAQFGRPGERNSPVFVFLRPSTMDLQALLALLALGAEHPGQVFLLEGPEEALEDGMVRLGDQCRSQQYADALLSYALISMIQSLPGAVLVNAQLMITASTENLLSERPEDFEISLRRTLHQTQTAAFDAPTWGSWLSRQKLRQLVRCGPGDVGVRLDGVLHQPAVSKAELFRVRSLREEEVAVDLWLEEQNALFEFI